MRTLETDEHATELDNPVCVSQLFESQLLRPTIISIKFYILTGDKSMYSKEGCLFSVLVSPMLICDQAKHVHENVRNGKENN